MAATFAPFMLKLRHCTIFYASRNVLKKAQKKCSGSTIYLVRVKTSVCNAYQCQDEHGEVSRIKVSSSLCNSQPCQNCIRALHKYGVKKVCYSVDGGTWVTEKVSQLVNSTVHVSRGQRLVKQKQSHLLQECNL